MIQNKILYLEVSKQVEMNTSMVYRQRVVHFVAFVTGCLTITYQSYSIGFPRLQKLVEKEVCCELSVLIFTASIHAADLPCRTLTNRNTFSKEHSLLGLGSRIHSSICTTLTALPIPTRYTLVASPEGISGSLGNTITIHYLTMHWSVLNA